MRNPTKRTRDRIRRYIKGHQSFTTTEISDKLNIDFNSVRAVLNELTNKGVVKVIIEKKIIQRYEVVNGKTIKI